jgi:amino acid permease
MAAGFKMAVKTFFNFKISKMIIFQKTQLCCIFLLKIQILCNYCLFLENQNEEFIYNFFLITFMFNSYLFYRLFYGQKIKPMLPIMKIRNGAQIQDGRQNVLNLCI